MRAEEESAAIVQAIIGLARSLGVESQAEGVEDQETLDQLTTWGCGQAQGFHIGAPMAPGALQVWLASSGSRIRGGSWRSRPG
jgi:EAL domain-containing protein (putative c-di-GMP-specific phosphodiesterase class I)